VHRPSKARGCARGRGRTRPRQGASPSHPVRLATGALVLPAPDGSCQGSDLRPSADDLEQIRTATLCLINRERAGHGESPLRVNAQLALAAQWHTESMVAGGYFAHVGPSGRDALDRMRAAGYIASPRVGYEIGENIAWGTGQLSTPRAIVAAWMGSPGHRANILDARYRDTAIGVSSHLPGSLGRGAPGGIYTQDFGVIVAG